MKGGLKMENKEKNLKPIKEEIDKLKKEKVKDE